jgi:hypothetical protein
VTLLCGLDGTDSPWLMFDVSAVQGDPKISIADSERDGAEEPCGERQSSPTGNEYVRNGHANSARLRFDPAEF